MTEEQLKNAHEIWRTANAHQEKANAISKWARDNIKDGFYILKIPKQYIEGRFTICEEITIEIPCDAIMARQKELQQKADELFKQFANLPPKTHKAF